MEPFCAGRLGEDGRFGVRWREERMGSICNGNRTWLELAKYKRTIQSYPLKVSQNLVPEETPDFDDATDKFVLIYAGKFGVQRGHSGRNELGRVVL